jgi:hypothetical protein
MRENGFAGASARETTRRADGNQALIFFTSVQSPSCMIEQSGVLVHRVRGGLSAES